MDVDKTNSEKLISDYIQAGALVTSPERLRELATHENHRVRLRVAENANTPCDVLKLLSLDTSPDVKIAVASNSSTEEWLAIALAIDSDVIVRHGIAQNIDSPRKILEMLVEDENGWVKGEAVKTLQILDSRKGDELAPRRRNRAVSKRVVSNIAARGNANEEVAS